MNEFNSNDTDRKRFIKEPKYREIRLINLERPECWCYNNGVDKSFWDGPIMVRLKFMKE